MPYSSECGVYWLERIATSSIFNELKAEKIMESKLILENLQRYTKELEERHPNETAYWHLQKLKNEIERVKNITHEPTLSSVHTKWDCDGCKYYPCTHQDIVGNDKKLRYNQCGDHSERGTS